MYSSRQIPSTVEEVRRLLVAGKIVVMGGLKPGITTDTVAALVLRSTGSKLMVKATDQDGIFDKDPKKFADARKLDKLTYIDLYKTVTQETHTPGMHQILDLQSIQILESQKAKVIVVNGFDPNNILLAAKGEKVGTIVDVK